jgi:hypothetical protein
MSINRLRERKEEPAGQGPGDYFVVNTLDDSWCVSAPMAAVVERALRARWPAPWVAFVDIHGARVVLRTRRITWVAQCYASNRASYRAWNRAHGEEQRADRDWDE